MMRTSFHLSWRVKFKVQIGTRVITAGEGTLITKQREVLHAFWNATDAPARTLELISPAGLENYFAAMAELYSSGPPDLERAAEVRKRHNMDLDPASIPRLIEMYGLHLEAVQDSRPTSHARWKVITESTSPSHRHRANTHVRRGAPKRPGMTCGTLVCVAVHAMWSGRQTA